MPQQQQPVNEIDQKFLGLMSASGLSGATTAPTIPTPMPTASAELATPTSTRQEDSTSSSNEGIASLLRDLFPGLDTLEIQRYAAGLQSLGFDPNCESRYYLQAQDLTFMKVLHRRYFVAEIIGHEGDS